MTRPCATCIHHDVDPLAAAPVCDVTLTFAEVERRREHRTACGPEGRWWEGAREPTPAIRGVDARAIRSHTMPFPGPAEPAGGDFKQEVGITPFDTTNGLDGLGADMAPFTGPWGPSESELVAFRGMRVSGWTVAINLTLAVLGWAVLFGLGAGCLWVGWMLAQWWG